MSVRIKLESQAGKNEAGVELESSREVRVWWKKLAEPRGSDIGAKNGVLVADAARRISPYTSVYGMENTCYKWRVSVCGGRLVKGRTVRVRRRITEPVILLVVRVRWSALIPDPYGYSTN